MNFSPNTRITCSEIWWSALPSQNRFGWAIDDFFRVKFGLERVFEVVEYCRATGEARVTPGNWS